MKLFAPKKITASRTLLPYDKVRLFPEGEYRIDPEKAKKIIATAEELMNRDIPVIKASDFRDYFISGSRSKYAVSSGVRRQIALYLSLAEYIEGHSGRFAEKLMDAVWAIMEESTWIQPAHNYLNPYLPAGTTLPPVYGPDKLHGIDLSAGGVGALLTIVYLMAKKSLDRITPIICKKIEYSVHERITVPFLHCPLWWTGEGGRKVNNWGPWVASNVLFVTAVFEKDDVVRQAVVDRAITTIDNFLKDYAPDGGCDEGPSYWNAAGGSLFDCLELLEELSGGAINIYGEPLVRNIGEYIFKMNINENMFVNFADCGPKQRLSCEMLERFGQKTGSDGLVAFAHQHYADQMIVTSAMGYRSMKDLATPAPERIDSPLPTASWMPDLKVLTLRESGNSAEGTFLGAKGGSNGEMHNHNDVGNFVVYRNGNPVIIDTGVGTYTKQTFSSERYKLWFMQSGYHNLPSFCGADQMQGGAYASADECFSEDTRTLSMELSGAYTPAAGLDSYRRTLSLEGDTVKVTDSYKLKEVGECVFHFMSATEPKLVKEGTIALAENMTFSFDPALKCEIEAFDPVGMNTQSSWGTDVLYRIKLSVCADKGEYTFVFSPEK